MWLFPLAFIGLTIFGPALFADPVPCAEATLATYDVSGYQCTIDGFTLDDFTLAESGTASLLSDSEIEVTPTLTSSGISVQFSAASGYAFNIPSGQNAQYIIQYELDPQLPTIGGEMVDTGSGDPVNLIGQFCGNGTFTGPYVSGQPTSCMGTDTNGIFPATVIVPGNNNSGSAVFPLPVTDLDSRLILDMDGPASISSFGSTAEFSGVPEPSAALWLAPGMLGLMWLRKKRLANAQ
jgi:hypothetical protein